ncbi:MAG: glycine--tRNA ligase [Firmicutes bacterium]|nr:glycine--tRNA ligase [Bacillota bacterium]
MTTIEKITALCKSRGFVFPGSEIYGGLANTWDFGPLGAELKENIKREWWKFFVQQNPTSVGLDGGILMNSAVWKASGHVDGFNDPLIDCKSCKTRHRADHLIEKHSKGKVSADFKPNEWLEKWIDDNKVKCPTCGKTDWTKIRQFNLMFKTNRGVVEGQEDTVYLRPETAQNQFVNFTNVQRSMRMKIPFGIGQVGKAFRNEITPGNFIFRTIEFEQMEHQQFCHAKDAKKFYEDYKKLAWEFNTKVLGINEKNLRFKDHETLCHYAKMACDIDYNFSFGWGELAGTHHRSEFDLTQHINHSKKSLEYTDPVTNEKFVPTVIESSQGLNRSVLVCLHDAYHEEKVDDDTRVVLKLHPRIAPYKVAVLPLQKKEQGEQAYELCRELSKHFACTYDDTASIGKRYRRQDEIGTPFCITVDFDSVKGKSVTIRHRDTMKQERIKTKEIESYVKLHIL